MDQYKYDIALSFLARDEHIAMEIYGRLKDRYNIFVYSEQQKHLAGKDGEGAFKKVFEVESKLVVVLYRSEWGNTPWTRMEQTGIRDRAYNQGYEFCTFITLEEKPTMPDWFPKQRLYASHPRFGIESAVTVIDSRAQEAQIQSRELTVFEQAELLEKQRLFEVDRHKFLNSHDGGAAIQSFCQELRGAIRENFTLLAKSMPTMGIQDKSNDHQVGIVGEGPSLMVAYRQPYINSIEASELQVGLYQGGPPLSGLRYYERPVQIKSMNMTIDRTESMPLCWLHEGRHYSNAEAADLIAQFWLKHQPNGRKSG